MTKKSRLPRGHVIGEGVADPMTSGHQETEIQVFNKSIHVLQDLHKSY